MQLNEFYLSVGGKYETVLDRLQSEQIIRKFLLKFLKDQSYSALQRAVAEKDTQAAFSAAHTLKGTAANLGLDSLAQAASVLTEQLRNAAAFPENASVTAVEEAYYTAVKTIALLEI